MWLRPSTSRSAVAVLTLWPAVAAVGVPASAWAQACCAGGSAVTPGRLELHEDALVGMQLKFGQGLGSYDGGGHFVANGAGDAEQDFEQDAFAALRISRRGQVALLVPLIETRRVTPTDGAKFGGGAGDVNASVRYDFVLAGESRYVPGVAVLAGLTVPTGTPPESSTAPLAVDATGVGAYQGSVALALEQTFGAWLVNATAIVSARTPRFGETLGTQTTLLVAGAYTFPNDMAAALAVSYAFEPDATTDGGARVAASSKRLTVVTLSALWPITDTWRLLGGLFVDPPVDAASSNQPSSAGLSVTVIRS